MTSGYEDVNRCIHDQKIPLPFISNADERIVFSVVPSSLAVSCVITLVRCLSVEDEHVHDTALIIRTVIDEGT